MITISTTMCVCAFYILIIIESEGNAERKKNEWELWRKGKWEIWLVSECERNTNDDKKSWMTDSPFAF